jgi:iron complex transport system substrate-binding protein
MNKERSVMPSNIGSKVKPRASSIVFFFALAIAGAATAQAQARFGTVSAKDSLDRLVTVRTPVARVVSLSPAATEVVYAVGAGSTMVGDTQYCNYPAEALALPKVGGYAASTISIERILALKPDLVISSGSAQDQIGEALAELGIKVFAYDPQDFASIREAMLSIGVLLGTEGLAAAAADKMLAEIERIKSIVAAVPANKRPSVFWEVYDEPLMTCGSATFPHYIIEASGGRDIFSDLSGSWPRISSEEVIRRAPDYIMGADDHGDRLTVAVASKRPGWANVPAVKAGRILLLPADPVSRASPRIAEGVRLVATALYPALFK